MNQKGLSFFYRGVIFFILAGIAVEALPASPVKNIANILLFIAAGVFIFLVVFRVRGFFSAPIVDKPLPLELYSDNWYHLARFADIGCVLLALMTAAILLFVPPPKQCQNWHLPDGPST